MSIVLQGSTSGSVTLQEPAVAGTTVLDLPAVSGTVVLQNGSNNLLMNSGYGSNAVAYGCRAWVNFNGTGTPAIRASGNVSSITDHGTGEYTINLSTAMSDLNFNFVGTTEGIGMCVAAEDPQLYSTTSSIRMSIYRGGYFDRSYVYAAIFR